MAVHPGWRRGGSIRRNKSKFLLLDNGTQNLVGEWVFNISDIYGHEWQIIPMMSDIYIPEYLFHSVFQMENLKMINRNWIVVSSLSGPSPNPVKHTSEESAIEEAKRLALKNPSAQFYVYELKRAYQVETVKEIEVSDIPF